MQFFAKEKLDISKEHIEGTIHCKPGAANALLETAYTLLTRREWVALAIEGEIVFDVILSFLP